MKKFFTKPFVIAGAVLALGILNADAKVPSEAEVDQMIDNAQTAKADVAKTAKGVKSSDKAAEDFLDKSEKGVDTAEKDLKREKSVKNNDKGIKAAEAKVKTAKGTRDMAKQFADKNGDAKYRAALKKLRDARKAMEEAYQEMRGKPGTRDRRKQLKRVIKDTATSAAGTGRSFTMNQGVNRAVAMNAATRSHSSVAVLIRGGRHCHP